MDLYFLLCKTLCTVCPRSSDPFYVVTYYIEWVTTSWTHSSEYNECTQCTMYILYTYHYQTLRTRTQFISPGNWWNFYSYDKNSYDDLYTLKERYICHILGILKSASCQTMSQNQSYITRYHIDTKCPRSSDPFYI